MAAKHGVVGLTKTAAISGVSRALSHQFVRHRIGISFEQQSQRYVRYKEDRLDYVTPKTWEKTPGSDISLCTHALPAGKVYLMRNTNRGIAVSTHLGTGEYENHTCVYGDPGKPEGGSRTYGGPRPMATSSWRTSWDRQRSSNPGWC